jgi:pimeloyl-ACP methyl ester carboxylesterase
MLLYQTTLPYQLEGNGYPLLLIHGMGVTYATWHKLAPLLAPHFQLIMVELPGAGALSDVVFDKPYYATCAEALEELRKDLGIEQWAILAYSTGTRVGEVYAQQYPQRVSRAVFLCPIYLRKSLKRILRIFLRIDVKRSGVANWLLSDWRIYALLLLIGFNMHRHDLINDWMREIKLLPTEQLKRIITDLPGIGRTPFMLPTSPEIPTLFVWGLRDVLTAPPPHPRPNDAIIVTCHSAPVLSPMSVAEVVLPFLKEEVASQNTHPSTVAQKMRY